MGLVYTLYVSHSCAIQRVHARPWTGVPFERLVFSCTTFPEIIPEIPFESPFQSPEEGSGCITKCGWKLDSNNHVGIVWLRQVQTDIRTDDVGGVSDNEAGDEKEPVYNASDEEND